MLKKKILVTLMLCLVLLTTSQLSFAGEIDIPFAGICVEQDILISNLDGE